MYLLVVKNKSGVGLIELLIALAIVSIMMTGVYFTYITFTKTALDTRQVAKSESEVNQALLKLEKLLQSAGFGISQNEPDVFVVDNSPTEITFKTLFGDKMEAGLWEVCVNNSRNVANNYPVVALSENENLIDFYDNTGTCSNGNILYVCKDSNSNGKCDYIDNVNDNYFYEKTLRLSANASVNYSWSKNCAPNTKNLLINNDPYLGCLADFVVERPNKKTVKLGIIYQKGNKKDTPISKTYNYDSLSGSYTLDAKQEYYRWKKVEIVLDLVNLN
ncbi:hypothetical protein Flexsi_0850 [Flexistipes sinusarabici DSM 4947]|uniref:Prepilin-type N-terminal cleavage/methylation domain-containing protein n=1 Tax=Flexistipes sinusarabici (strain ATCC 49648 / DSM 4947 / MAS 10) TaxID=717231 RepID=F8E4U4_FLESM|nr:prepilin-type N-terminal cleavage/methylation domain-containing protein [Flexistipes sinusarabici]AEI14514.1 hypothetical protein Flexsi_0850 [Flexistipes sinusarabici DSM 4947]